MKKKKTAPGGRKRTAKTGRKRSKKAAGLFSDKNTLVKSLVEKENEIIRTQDALVESMKRFRDLFEQSPIGGGIHDTAGDLLIVNKAYLRIFGFKTFSDIGRHNLFCDFKLTAKDSEKVHSGEVVQYDIEYDFDKVDFPTSRAGIGSVHFTISPLFRDDKDISGFMVQVQDITERKKIEESQRLAHLGRLLSEMAHEVNNPLMIISGRAELAMLETSGDDRMKSTLDIIVDQCFFAKDIIQRLLRYSRIGKIEKGEVDLNKALELVIDLLSHHFKMSNIKVEKDIKPDLILSSGNEKQLQEVFMNIIRNSSDAMADGGRITIKASKKKGVIRVEISDTGCGMPRKVLNRIFEPFFTTKPKGTGLGMAVCYTIIKDHGGDLQYTSKVGKGTTATILLPAENQSGP
ncbi:MAG: ATP-binding protein [Candidatus Omnitrophota bacterium]